MWIDHALSLLYQKYRKISETFYPFTLEFMKIAITTIREVAIYNVDPWEKLWSLPCQHDVPFGVTWNDDNFFIGFRRHEVKAKNLPRLQRVIVYDKNLKKVDEIRHGDLSDCHQVVWHDDKLWIVSTGSNSIIIWKNDGSDWREWETWCPNPEKTSGDWNHFNSIWFEGDRVFVSAHNWERPGQVYEFEYPSRELVQIHEAGRNPHNVFRWRNRLATLSSFTGELAFLDGQRHKIADWYTRGIAIADKYVLVGASQYIKDRNTRFKDGKGDLLIYDKEFKLQRQEHLGSGSVWDVRLLDEADPLTHHGKAWTGLHGI